ncbi:outer membrane beta-barrel protein [Myroides sp. DF42-4-2]|uniref:outer membrane beta-barrel protein n=1 Tax=unclassified Myroides TaxID=2642485 RepID=UPI002576FC1D|nr:outer membrane beta-barrel protein [Myroides sp. DF42-4-2]MDM1408431.1 porin family protein [Myroides sp. DF42-4-2]
MKKLVLSLVAVAAFGFTANAQEKEKPTFGFQEGNVMIEGSFQIKDQVEKDSKTGVKVKNTHYNFNPKIGYFLSDKVAVGASLGFGKANVGSDVIGTDITGTTLYAGAFARYYFLELGNRFKTYAEVGVGYQEGKVSDMKYKETGIAAGIDLGFNYFVTEKLAVTFALGNVFSYKNYDMKTDGNKVGSISETEANLNVFNNFFDNATFGLVYKF